MYQNEESDAFNMPEANESLDLKQVGKIKELAHERRQKQAVIIYACGSLYS